MSVLLLHKSKQIRHVSTVCHASGDTAGLREVTDPASCLAVYVFPFIATNEVLSGSDLERLGFYLLTSRERVYVGEGVLASRLRDHAGAPDKQFATEVFAVGVLDNHILDKQAVRYCERKLFERARERGYVRVVNEATPPGAMLSHSRSATLDRLLEEAERLLFDAGCRVFNTNEATQEPANSRLTMILEQSAESNFDMAEIPSFVLPADSVEHRLTYSETLLARGYDVGDGFVVCAGSDMRNQLNPSANPIIGKRRERLVETGAVVEIPSLSGRFQFRLPVRFTSPAIAAQVVTGAHVNASHWTTIDHPVIARGVQA